MEMATTSENADTMDHPPLPVSVEDTLASKDGGQPIDESVSSLSGDDHPKPQSKRPLAASEEKSQDDDDDMNNNSHKRPKPTIDLTTIEGQLTAHPELSHSAAKLAAKREYNRLNAARARLRNKHMVEQLQHQVQLLTSRAQELQTRNDILTAQVTVLSQQNQLLIMNQDPTARLLLLAQQQQPTLMAALPGLVVPTTATNTLPTVGTTPTPTTLPTQNFATTNTAATTTSTTTMDVPEMSVQGLVDENGLLVEPAPTTTTLAQHAPAATE